MESLSLTSAYDIGYSQGQKAALSPYQNNQIFLVFGSQNSSNSGTTNWGHPHSYAQDAAWAEQYALGWYYGTGTDSTSILHLVVSTNNSGPITGAQGTTWANSVVDVVSNWVINTAAIDSQVVVDGGIDAEPAYALWAPTKAWVDAFDAAVNSGRMVDFGSADGCSYTASETINAGCSNGWTRANEAYIAWHSRNWAQPEIYTDNNSLQWTLISRYSYSAGTGKILYDGPMVTSNSITAAVAWSTFWDDLNASSHSSQSLKYTTYITFKP